MSLYHLVIQLDKNGSMEDNTLNNQNALEARLK